MRLDKDWFEHMLQLHKRSQDVQLEEKERASARKAFTMSLNKIKKQDILKKKKEELQYLPIGWILERTDTYERMQGETGEITMWYKELSLPFIFEIYTR